MQCFALKWGERLRGLQIRSYFQDISLELVCRFGRLVCNSPVATNAHFEFTSPLRTVYICVYCAYRIYTDGVCVTEALFLSQNDSRPMYLQIMEQIKQKVRAGDWPAGHPLPSIRELSVSTQVSVITVKRAYTELEQEGVIVTQAGRGSFVADVVDVQKTLLEAELEKYIAGVVNTGHALGLSDSQIVALVKKALVNSR